MTSYATLPYLATCSDHSGWVYAVGGDVKVEQSIQRVSNGPGELLAMPMLWQSKNEFELLFNEIVTKTNSS